MYIFRMFLISWLVTVIVEEAVSLILGCRSIRDILTVLWINTVTNPAAVGIRLLSSRYFPEQWMRMMTVIAVEAAVVLSEWGLMRKFMKTRKNFFLLSIILNAASYGAGLLLPLITALFR